MMFPVTLISSFCDGKGFDFLGEELPLKRVQLAQFPPLPEMLGNVRVVHECKVFSY